VESVRGVQGRKMLLANWGKRSQTSIYNSEDLALLGKKESENVRKEKDEEKGHLQKGKFGAFQTRAEVSSKSPVLTIFTDVGLELQNNRPTNGEAGEGNSVT